MTKSKKHTRPKCGMYWDNPYDPNKEYYFVDYHCSYDCRWVRSPYNTWEEVVEIVKSLNSQWGFDKGDKRMVRFVKDLRITPESELAELHQVFNEETNKYEDDIINNRTYRFDGRYDIDEKWTGVKSLNKEDDETLEDWKKRVALAREEKEKVDKVIRDRNYASIHRIKTDRRANEKAKEKAMKEAENKFIKASNL